MGPRLCEDDSGRDSALRRNRLARLLDDVLGRAVELAQELVDVGTGHWIDLELELVALVEEGRILQCCVEGCTQRLPAIVRHAGRGGERASDDLPAGHQP